MYDININKFVDLTNIQDGWFVGQIYHYANEEIVPLILSQNCVSFRFTRIEDFIDKSEGKVINSYYMNALNKLHDDGTLSDYLYGLFSRITPPIDHAFPFSSDGHTLFVSEKAKVYIICFSKDASNPNMFKNYLKGTKRGCSIEFGRHLLNEHHLLNHNAKQFGNGYKLQQLDVLYGEDNVIELVRYIKEVLSCVNVEITEEVFRNYLVFAIETKLSNMQYCSKQEEFRYENEVRLVLLIAENGHNSVDPSGMFKQQKENNRRFVTV